MDILVGLVIFLVAVFVFYALVSSSTPHKKEKLEEDASILSRLTTSDNSLMGLISNNELNESRFISLKNQSYSQLKSQIKLDSDFCIFLEDEMGRVIEVNFTYKGLGSGKINITGTPCNST